MERNHKETIEDISNGVIYAMRSAMEVCVVDSSVIEAIRNDLRHIDKRLWFTDEGMKAIDSMIGLSDDTVVTDVNSNKILTYYSVLTTFLSLYDLEGKPSLLHILIPAYETMVDIYSNLFTVNTYNKNMLSMDGKPSLYAVIFTDIFYGDLDVGRMVKSKMGGGVDE
jgi:hypothetical protein